MDITNYIITSNNSLSNKVIVSSNIFVGIMLNLIGRLISDTNIITIEMDIITYDNLQII